jgi:acyl-coenzyme A synthetase/AMP-(fatty) acid ligase
MIIFNIKVFDNSMLLCYSNKLLKGMCGENMNKEELENLKSKIIKMEMCPLTGYASKDKPSQYYWVNNKESTYFDETLSMYDYLYLNNKNNLTSTAIKYYGTSINYAKLFKKIDRAVNAFRSVGINENCEVTLCLPYDIKYSYLINPELVYSLYALNKIGTKCYIIDSTISKEDMLKALEYTESEYIILIDKDYEKFKHIIRESNECNGIVIPNYNSAGVIKKLNTISKNMTVDIQDFSWNTLMWMANDYNKFKPIDYKNRMALGVFTSEMHKNIFSNEEINASVHAFDIAHPEVTSSNTIVHSQLKKNNMAFINSMHYSLVKGLTITTDLQKDREEFEVKLLKNRPAYMISSIDQYKSMLNSATLKKADLSFLKGAYINAELLSNKDLDLINTFFKQHNSPANLSQTWGNNDIGYPISTTCPKENKSTCSIGKSLPGIIVSAFDSQKNTECKYYERGELCISSNCTPLMNTFSYNNMKWLRTNKIGYTDELGNIYVEGLKDDFLIDEHGDKVYLFDIKNTIMLNKAVKECIVIAYKDLDGREYPLVHIILKDEYYGQENNVVNDLKNLCLEFLPTSSNPVGYKFRTTLPKDNNGSIAKQKLLNEKDGYKIVINDVVYNVSIKEDSYFHYDKMTAIKSLKRTI